MHVILAHFKWFEWAQIKDARLNSFENFSSSKIKFPLINFWHLLQKIKHTDLWDEVNGFDLNLKVDHEVML